MYSRREEHVLHDGSRAEKGVGQTGPTSLPRNETVIYASALGKKGNVI